MSINIESKAYQVRSAIGGGLSVYDKAAKQWHSIQVCDLPHVNALSAMTEKQFDEAVEEAISC